MGCRLNAAAFINFEQAGGGGVYSRVAFINFEQAGGGGVYSRATLIRGRRLLLRSRITRSQCLN